MSDQSLSGLRVVEYGNLVSAPYCAKMMADLGAEVIKIEHPDSPDESRRHGPFLNNIPHPERSGLFLHLNTNKLGITLNPESATGRKLFLKLLKDADIFVENNPVQRMKDLRLDYDSIAPDNPRLIMTSITPFGQTGPHKDYKGYDINIQAAGGTTQGIGLPDREPLAMPLFQGQYQAAMCAAIASLVALYAREASGEGQLIDISEVEVLATMHTGWDVLNHIFKWKHVSRSGSHAQGIRYPDCILPCKDGYMLVGASRKRQWERLVGAMGNPAWTREPKFQNMLKVTQLYADEADAHMTEWLMQYTKAELFDISLRNRLSFAPVTNMDEVVASPHLAARGFFQDVDRAETGSLKYPGVPFHLSETPPAPYRPAPLLGEHNELIYCERLGYSREELAGLRRRNII